MSKLYASITGCTNPISVRINSSHGNATAVAQIDCVSFTGSINDLITVDLGFIDNHDVLFTGYVKQIDRTVSPNTYHITAHDVLIRAADYFIVSDDPDVPYSKSNISAESLVEDLLNMSGLPDPIVPRPSTFTFGVYSPVEINLVSAYDFIKVICDILAWSIWTDKDGNIYFGNRKPYVMVAGSPESLQPGFIADTPDAELVLGDILDAVFLRSEKDLRNKVVVYGKSGISATAEVESCFLPSGFRKTSVLASDAIDDQTVAQKAADYNLSLYHRLNKIGNVEIIGNPLLLSRKIVTLNAPAIDSEFSGDWYIYTAEHSWSKEGYKTSLELRSYETC